MAVRSAREGKLYRGSACNNLDVTNTLYPFDLQPIHGHADVAEEYPRLSVDSLCRDGVVQRAVDPDVDILPRLTPERVSRARARGEGMGMVISL